MPSGDRIMTLHPGERAIIFTPSPENVLNPTEWQALADAESRIFRGEISAISYTDVIPREEAQVAAACWLHAREQMDAAGELQHDHPEGQGAYLSPAVQHAKIASRVAKALAVLVFGPEFLLK